MTAKYFPDNRAGKNYPVLEIDVGELIDNYLRDLDEVDLESFIENWVGHHRFLEVASKHLIESYSGTNMNTDTTEARAKLLQALGDHRIGIAADIVAQSMRQKHYYETLYWQFYHGMSEFLRDLSAEDNQRWHGFFRRYQEANPAPAIGSPEWQEYGEKARTEALQILKNHLENGVPS